jgi:hypothetical protein
VGTVIWWRWSSLPIHDPQWIQVLDRLSRELGLARSPRLAVSLRAKDAFSLGLFRPLIVLPAAWLMQLSPATLESVLAHELAHIRRFDAWANLFQRVLESWLFYHPAVWWLSRQMELEREKCCDLRAVSLTGDRLQYVKTLAGIAEHARAGKLAKSNGPILSTAMGGRNMLLLERVRHILGDTPRTGAASRFLAGTMVLAIPLALWAGAMLLPANAADDEVKLQAQAEGDGDGNRRRDGDAPRQGPRDGEGRLMPVVRREIYAPVDGVVIKILQVNPDGPTYVKAGQLLLELKNDELQAQLTASESQLIEKLKHVVVLEAQIAKSSQSAEAQDQKLQYQGQLEETKAEIIGLQEQVAIYKERHKHLNVHSPIDGVLATFQVEQKLLNRPVRRGETLLEVMDDQGPRDGERPRPDGPRDGARPRPEGQRDGDRPRPEGQRDGDRPRPEGQRDGARPRPEGARDGARPRPEGQRDGDRPRPEGQRDGDRPRPEGQRDGDRPRPEGQRDGDRPRPEGQRDGDRPRPEGAPEGEGPRGFPRPGERGRTPLGPQAEMMLLIRELQREVEQLRNEVRELRQANPGGQDGPRPGFRRPEGEGPRPDFRRPEGDGPRPEFRRPEGDGPRPEFRRPEGERPRPDARPDGERPRPEARRPESERGEGERREVERREEIERGEARERLEEARDEAAKAERENDKDEGGEEVSTEKHSAAEALLVFTVLDKNKDSKLDQEEWAASKAIRKEFEKQSIKLSPPVDYNTFLDRYPSYRLIPQLRLPGDQ